MSADLKNKPFRQMACGMPRSRTMIAGFTLIELMIVVAVIAIIAAIALPSYQAFIVKSRRKAAEVCLQERAQFMERYYATHLSYAGAPDPAQCDSDLQPFYRIAFSGTPDATRFTLTATPQGGQNDPKCNVLSIDEKGSRGVTGTDTAANCW